jgi:competence protein ComEA
VKQRELLVSIFIIVVLLAINTINFMRRESVRRSNIFIVEEGRIELSLNTVSAVELCDLPGVGPVLAERIIAYREQKGGFKSLEELKEVKGIGDKTYNRISPYVKL